MEYRIEHDSMGEVQVPADRYWGAQTQRSFQNFPIGTEKIPIEVIRAFAILKKAAAIANNRLGKLDDKRLALISQACDEILAGASDQSKEHGIRKKRRQQRRTKVLRNFVQVCVPDHLDCKI